MVGLHAACGEPVGVYISKSLLMSVNSTCPDGNMSMLPTKLELNGELGVAGTASIFVPSYS